MRISRILPVFFCSCLLSGSVLGQAASNWWNHTTFYEIFVRSFYDSDGDGKGDIRGLISQLDYLNDGDPNTSSDLGITGIWLMPVFESPTYHGYDTSDYLKIDTEYGTLQDFKDLLSACHQRGIKVIVDYVMNHCSSQHPWFLDASASPNSAYRNWFRWSSTYPGTVGPWGQNVWHLSGNGNYYYGLFWSGMPDLNYETPGVKQEMFDIATYWLDSVGVDGFRADAILYIYENGSQLANVQATFDFWEDFRTHYKGLNPDAIVVGEAWTNTATVANYTGSDKLDLCFEFELAEGFLSAADGNGPGTLMSKMDAVLSTYTYPEFASFLTNHDQNRVFSVLGENWAKAKLAAGLLLTFPGTPFIYYGEEIGMTGTGAHENIRTPMQWNANLNAGFSTGTPWWSVNADYLNKNVDAQKQDSSSLLNWYRHLIHLRNQDSTLNAGTFDWLAATDNKTVGYIRSFSGTQGPEWFIVAANLSGDSLDNVILMGLDQHIGQGGWRYSFPLSGDTAMGTFWVNGGQGSMLNVGTLAPYAMKAWKVHGPFVPIEQPPVLPWKLYPNPARNSAMLQISSQCTNLNTLSLYDVRGRHVKDFSVNRSRSLFLDLSDLRPGSYLLRATCPGISGSMKLLKLEP